MVRWYRLFKIIYPTSDNLYWFTRYATCSNSFSRHFYCGFISNDHTFITLLIRIIRSVIPIQLSVLGNPDFRSSLCAEQPGKMNIKLRMYIRGIVNFLDINRDFVGQKLIFGRLFICRLESDWKGRWTSFSHLLQIMETLRRRTHKLIQLMPAKCVQ